MPIEVRMPKLSDNMEEGTIIRWYKQAGDRVTEGEALAEVETEKADVEVEAADSGVVSEIRVAQGQSAGVGDVIAILAAEGESTSASPRQSTDSRSTRAEEDDGDDARRPADEESPSPRTKDVEPAANRKNAPVEANAKPADDRPTTKSDDQPRRSKVTDEVPQHLVRASTVARRMAEEAGIKIGRVAGSGPGGLVLKRDVEAAIGPQPKEKPPNDKEPVDEAPGADGDESVEAKGAPPPAPEKRRSAAAPRTQVLELSRMRATIARRMAEAKREIPHFYVTSEIDMTEAMRMRQTLKETGTIATLTVTHLIVKALGIALARQPRVNGSWQEGTILLHDEINIGVAVAVDDGLLVPVLHNVERLSLREISGVLLSLTEKARSGRFGGDDLSGGTFSLSNLGTLDIEEIAAVINPPQAAILACGAVKDRPVVRAGALAVAKTMRATLSCDHRVLNGVEGARFLEELKGLLESPVLLVAD